MKLGCVRSGKCEYRMDYRLHRFSAREITPLGWLKNQLTVQAKGLTGHVSEIWPDLSVCSAWLGGSGEAWERGPYYLDGLIPLAWLTGDERLMQEKTKWIEALCQSQRPNGNFGPERNPDVWPRFVAMKALIQEYNSAKDERILALLLSYCHFLDQNIVTYPPKFWASARALEPVEPILALYEITKEPFLLGLIDKLQHEMMDWFSYFRHFPYPKKTGKYLSKPLFNAVKWVIKPLDALAKKDLRIKEPEKADVVHAFNDKKNIKTMMMTHGVNIAMALKYPTLYGMLHADKTLLEEGKKAYETVMKYHGTAIGIHSADEHLSGPSSYQGTELCAVVEEMYSFEQMLAATADPFYADRLDDLAFNALPATFSADMTKHQYVQQPNQISADRHMRSFYDTDREGNIYGLAPNYGCCLANMHQGFPKYASSLVFRTDSGICIMGYAPQAIESTLFGETYRMTIRGNYPFESTIDVEIDACTNRSMTLKLRIPENTEGTLWINDEEKQEYASGMVSLDRIFQPKDCIHLELSPHLVVVNNADGSVSFWYGSLLLAMPIAGEIRTIRGKEPFTDISIKGTSVWNVAPLLKDGKLQIISNQKRPVSVIPFDSEQPPLEWIVEGMEIRNWKTHRHSAGDIPKHLKQGEPIRIRLVPYGSTDLRIAAFPRLEE